MLNKIIKLFTGVWLSQEDLKNHLDFASRNGQIWVLDNVKAEIIKMRSEHNCSCSDCIDIIDKYKSQAEERLKLK